MRIFCSVGGGLTMMWHDGSHLAEGVVGIVFVEVLTLLKPGAEVVHPISITPLALKEYKDSVSTVYGRLVAAAGGTNTCQNRKHTQPERARAVGTVRRPSSLQRLWHGQSGTQPSSAIMPASPAVVLDAGSTGYLHCL